MSWVSSCSKPYVQTWDNGVFCSLNLLCVVLFTWVPYSPLPFHLSSSLCMTPTKKKDEMGLNMLQ